MHMKRDGHHHGPKVVPVRFILENPAELTDSDQKEWEVKGAVGEHLLEVALDAGINIEHSCGGVCACSTCHVYVEEGMEHLTEAEEDEEDRVEEAPALQRNSRLSCQIEVSDDLDGLVVRMPELQI